MIDMLLLVFTLFGFLAGFAVCDQFHVRIEHWLDEEIDKRREQSRIAGRSQ